MIKLQSMQLETGSIRLRRVVCGVAPQTLSRHHHSPNSAGKRELRSRRRDAVSSTRDACAPQEQLHRSGLTGAGGSHFPKGNG